MTDKELYIKLLEDCERDTSGLLKWLETTSFYNDPASANKHNSFPGGLVRHSLNVYYAFLTLYPSICALTDCYKDLPIDTVKIVTLLHDLCKIGTYKTDKKNVKVYGTKEELLNKGYSINEIKTERGKKYAWDTQDIYKYNETSFKYGHGELSVYYIMKYMNLTDQECQAIRFHMSSWVEGDKQMLGEVYTSNPIALTLHLADECATYFIEKDETTPDQPLKSDEYDKGWTDAMNHVRERLKEKGYL